MIKIKHWTSDEDKLLRRKFKKYGVKAFDMVPTRTRIACMSRAHRIGLTTRISWSDEDDEILKKYYPSMGGNVCIKMNNRHSMQACYSRAYALGISRYH